jgi:hypothetical protein
MGLLPSVSRLFPQSVSGFDTVVCCASLPVSAAVAEELLVRRVISARHINPRFVEVCRLPRGLASPSSAGHAKNHLQFAAKRYPHFSESLCLGGEGNYKRSGCNQSDIEIGLRHQVCDVIEHRKT